MGEPCHTGSPHAVLEASCNRFPIDWSCSPSTTTAGPDVELVGPLLARHGFGATFYVTEGLGFEDKSRFLDWDEIRWLHDAGFEIGNHHGRHVAVDTQTREEFERDLRHMEESCAAHGIPKPVTYCYPGGHHCRTAVEALHDAGVPVRAPLLLARARRSRGGRLRPRLRAGRGPSTVDTDRRHRRRGVESGRSARGGRPRRVTAGSR